VFGYIVVAVCFIIAAGAVLAYRKHKAIQARKRWDELISRYEDNVPDEDEE
jgi:hypothetical protein